MKKQIVTMLLAFTMIISPVTEIMAVTVNETDAQMLASENQMSEEEIREMEEHYEFILKMQEAYKKNPTKLLSDALRKETLSEEELASYTTPEAYEEQLWKEINEEVEKRSASKVKKEETTIFKRAKKIEKHSYKDVLHSSKKSLKSKEKKKVKKAKEKALESGAEAAEVINQLEGDTFFTATKEVLDGYYADAENIEEEKIAEFEENIDGEAEELLEGYKVALEERKNAEDLDYETEHVIVTFEEGTPFTDMQGIAECLGGEMDILDGTNKELEDYMAEGALLPDEKLIVKYGIGIGQTVEMAQEVLGTVDGVYGVDANEYIEVSATSYTETNDAGRNEQSYLSQVNVNEAWNALSGSLGYCDYENNESTIAIIDTGFDVTHDELKDVLSEKSITVREKDSAGNFKSLFNCGKPYYDDHGSHVTGIIAAQTNNIKGMVGITNIYDAENDEIINTCEIIGINVGIGAGGVSLDSVVDGIYYAMNNDADVINMSFGGYEQALMDYYTSWQTAIYAAHYAGVVLVAAAGNDGVAQNHYPASYSFVISVAALNTDGVTKWESSNYGANIDISAPGTNIYSCGVNDSSMTTKSGTSMAAPMVTATVGFMRAVNKDLTPQEIENILYETATDLYDSGWDEYTGYGRVNLGEAVKRARELSFADSSYEDAYEAECYGGGESYSVYGMVGLNPAADKYIVYKSDSVRLLGTPIMELGRNMITTKEETDDNGNSIEKKYIQFAQWMLPSGTYYYNIEAQILDGDTVEKRRLVIGQYAHKVLEVTCTMPKFRLQKLSSSKNSLYAVFWSDYDKIAITRADNSSMSQGLKYFSTTAKTFTDTTGIVGKQYYYNARAIRETGHVTYYSNLSDTVSMTIE